MQGYGMLLPHSLVFRDHYGDCEVARFWLREDVEKQTTSELTLSDLRDDSAMMVERRSESESNDDSMAVKK